MLKNYFKIALRNMIRHKAYSGINIIGLAIGISACLLILQYVSFELSFENFQTKKGRIFRVRQDRYNKGKLSTQWAAGAYAVGNSFKDAIPEIEDYVKVVRSNDQVVIVRNQPYQIERVFFASPSFFTIFSYALLEGDPKTVLVEPFTIVISETTARNLFGDTHAIGKTLNLNEQLSYKITGVFKDMPANTQLKPNALLSYASFLKLEGNNQAENAWQRDGCLTYLLLHKDANPRMVEAKFPAIVEKLAGAGLKKYNSSAIYLLQPIQDIHLYSHYMKEPGVNGDGKTVYLLL